MSCIATFENQRSLRRKPLFALMQPRESQVMAPILASRRFKACFRILKWKTEAFKCRRIPLMLLVPKVRSASLFLFFPTSLGSCAATHSPFRNNHLMFALLSIKLPPDSGEIFVKFDLPSHQVFPSFARPPFFRAHHRNFHATSCIPPFSAIPPLRKLPTATGESLCQLRPGLCRAVLSPSPSPAFSLGTDPGGASRPGLISCAAGNRRRIAMRRL